MKILVTGAHGQVGFLLKEKLAQSDWAYMACSRQELDIAKQEDVDRCVAEFKPNIIINAAAYTAVDKAEVNQADAYAINRDGVLYLAMAAKQHNAIFIHISTDYVFDGSLEGEYSERDLTAPQSIYGASKLAGEEVIKSILEKYIVLRTSWVFGEHGNNFVKTMVRLGRDRDQLGVVADQFGGPTYAGDIVSALLKIVSAIDSKRDVAWGIYHYSGMPHVSWFDFASVIFKEVDAAGIYTKSVPAIRAITTAEYPTPAKRPKNSKLDCAKLLQEFSIESSDWRSALKNIKAYV